MSYYGVLDICVHFHSFRSIDLLYQGLYQLRARVYNDLAENKTSDALIGFSAYSSSDKKASNARPGIVDSDCIAAYPFSMIPSRLEKDDFKIDILPEGSLETRPACLRPSSSFGTRESCNKTRRVEHHRVAPAFIDGETQSFTTTTFLIRYCDEEVELNNLCQFRVELDLCEPRSLSSPVYLEVDLMYGDPSTSNASTGSPENATSSGNTAEQAGDKQTTVDTMAAHGTKASHTTMGNEMFASRLRDKASFEAPPNKLNTTAPTAVYPEDFPWKPKFYSVAFQVYKIHNACSGVHEYVPVLFDENHFSLCSLTVHTCLIDIRPRLRDNMIPCSYQPRHRRPKPPPKMLYDREASDTKGSLALTNGSGKATSAGSRLPSRRIHTFDDFLNKGHRALSDVQASLVYIQVTELDACSSKPRAQSVKSESESSVTSEDGHKSAASAVDFVPSIPPSLIRADGLHIEYLRLLLASLAGLQLFFRSFICSCFTFRERCSLGPTVDFPPMELPGSDRIFLPGSIDVPPNSLLNQQLLESPPKRTTSFNPPRGSGRSFYTQADLLAVTIRISSDIVQKELELVRQESVVERQERERLLPKALDLQAHIPRLSARLESSEGYAIAALMTQDFQLIGSQTLNLWHRYLNLLPIVHSELCCFLRQKNEVRAADYWRESIFRETCHETQLIYPAEKCLWEVHQRIADHLRKSMHYRYLEPCPVMDNFSAAFSDSRPILFEQRYGVPSMQEKNEASPSASPQSPQCSENLLGSGNTAALEPYGIHCVVFVHGFQGNAYDMRSLRNMVSAFYPSTVLLCSSANEDDTEGCIEAMGRRLAKEITRFIDDWNVKSCLTRLSFICHSLGGVIARAALIHLKSFWPKLYTFISLSSPHLGYMYSSNRWVEAGIWVLKKWRKSLSLQQLTLSDAKSIHESYLYKLSAESEPLGQFEYVCFVSSYQDQYVPFESARVEMSSRAEKDIRLGNVYKEMATNILKYIKPEHLIRFNVNFRIMEKSLDNFIGRAAHIQFLENSVFMHMLFQAYPQFFASS